jgi:OHCU decarboxylase
MDRDTFVDTFGGIFEHSPWIAERAHGLELGPTHDTARGVHSALARVFRTASEEERLGVLNAHPDLAGKLAAAKRLTAESTSEQASAGLDALTDAERAAFTELNTAYTAKFGFPFIIAVRDHDKAGILAAFRRRIDNDRETEFAEACRQVERIAELRLHGPSAMSREIVIAPLTARAFAPFGEVLEATGDPGQDHQSGPLRPLPRPAPRSTSWTGAPGSACSNPRRGACPMSSRWWNVTRWAPRPSCR